MTTRVEPRPSFLSDAEDGARERTAWPHDAGPGDGTRERTGGRDGGGRFAAEESAWIFLSAYGLMLGAVSLLWLVRGQLFDRELYETIGGMSWSLMKAIDAGVVTLVSALVRFGGALGVVVACFVMAVATTAYRRGERWAWYVMWTLPLVPATDLVILAAYGALTVRTLVWDGYMLALAAIGLGLPYRAFFPKDEEAGG